MTYTKPQSRRRLVFSSFSSCVLNFVTRHKWLINDILGELDWFSRLSTTYWASRDKVEHEKHISTVLERFQKYGIAINPAKCVFATDTTAFLGHGVDKNSCQPNAERVAMIREWPPLPTKKKQLQRSWGHWTFIADSFTTSLRLRCLITIVQSNLKSGTVRWNGQIPREQVSTPVIKLSSTPGSSHTWVRTPTRQTSR